ncbi:head maturation protease, ClpP-related [Silvimonas soli]|uniref:head maturation protease, ClpP-related n=1 Tax=Silvimonas soli TaxID=2980100 RepID=UPI0024B3B978|nr:head maturation protease, ClpP-related [Silvimonas soli]
MHPLQQLLISNRQTPRRFEAVNAASGDEATIYLYDAIVASQSDADWWGGVAADAFVKALVNISAPVIHLRINSPGGDVFAARAMETAVRQHPSQIIAHVDGLAASAASYLAIAADEVEIAPGGFFMIHKAWTVGWGNADDFTATAGLLGKIDESLVQSYAAETGQTPDQIREWMAAETWLTGDEAVKYGFANRLASDTAKAQASWDLSAFAHAPAGLNAALRNPPPAEPAAPAAPDMHAERERQLALLNRAI